MFSSNLTEILVCPETKTRINLCTLAEAEIITKNKLAAIREYPHKNDPAPIGPTSFILIREDGLYGYPIINDIPIMLFPEILGCKDNQQAIDLSNPIYAEAYEEMAHYNKVAIQESENIRYSESYNIIKPIFAVPKENRSSFPKPKDLWLDAVYDCAGQWDAYNHMAPIKGKRILQIGGKGMHAVKFLLAGAEEAWVLSPMLGEMYCAMALSKIAGVFNRLHCVVAVAERLPFEDNYFDAVYSGGCVHHMVTSFALPEIARVLCSGGKLSAVDPWNTPFHAFGTRLLGKREKNVHCRPLDEVRIEPLLNSFTESRVVHHGALFRYPLLALEKFGISVSLKKSLFIANIDDNLSSIFPAMRDRFGGSVALLGVK